MTKIQRTIYQLTLKLQKKTFVDMQQLSLMCDDNNSCPVKSICLNRALSKPLFNQTFVLVIFLPKHSTYLTPFNDRSVFLSKNGVL